ncbi:alpha/beta hydrolase [Nocardia pseudobrasiliensis]
MTMTPRATVSTSGRLRATANIALSGLFLGALAVAGATNVSAAPSDSAQNVRTDVTAPDGSRIIGVESIDGRNVRLQVHSAAMDRTFPVEVQLPADNSAPRPSLYLLAGADGGMSIASWQAQTDVRDFMADKNVNLILPIGGQFSYYTDWQKDDPVLGRNKWKTYFTEELPPLMDAALNTNGRNAIAGISTSGTSVLSLPIAKPGLYQAVAAYSGCAQTSDPIGANFVNAVVEGYGHGTITNMWGPAGSEDWVANDPYVQAEQLRGIELYVSSGNGMPGKYEVLDGPHVPGGVRGLSGQIIAGGLIEAATNYCTHNLQDKLASLNIPATFDYTSGTHSWGYWQDDLKRSWPVLARGLGMS